MKTHPVRCLQKHYQRAVFWLKITSATSLLGLASVLIYQHFLRFEWIKTSQSMVKGAVGSFIGASDTSKLVNTQSYRFSSRPCFRQ